MTSLNGKEKKTKPKGIDLRGEKSEHRIFRSFGQRAVTPSLTAEAVCSSKVSLGILHLESRVPMRILSTPLLMLPRPVEMRGYGICTS